MGTFRTALDLQTKFAKLQEMEKNKESSNDPNSENTHKKEEKETLSEETDIHHAELRARLESEAANKGLEALWRGSKLEVEGVLRDVCELVLKVASEDGKEEEGAFDRALVRDRAEGLKIIGEVTKAYCNYKDLIFFIRFIWRLEVANLNEKFEVPLRSTFNKDNFF